jgi:hypothetical protein
MALMGYSRHIANDFWLEFDIVSAPSLSLDVRISNDYATLFPNYFFDRLLLLWWRSHRDTNNDTNYPKGYVNSIDNAMRYSVKDLMKLQWEIIDKHFHNDYECIEKAFEDFAQGVLYDSRRNFGKRIHMMDGDPPGILIGYYRWHTIVRAMSLVILEDNKKENDNEKNAGWLLQLDRNIGLAWDIQKKTMPIQDDDITEMNPGKNPNNQEIDSISLNKLRHFWLSQSFDEIDEKFDNEELQDYINKLYC